MTTLPTLTGLAIALAAAAAAAAPAHDYPTSDRVLYVQDCMKGHPGPYFEMVNKCSCAIDFIADAASHDEFVAMQTSMNAITIAGEGGGVFRDNPEVKAGIQRYKVLQAKALKACFIGPP
ncbi:MAG: hypothetical protein KGL18_09275 [Burkholderiales bacterium]|nr:hypothetical protein [Burkholderiales bacterium]MDE2157504.1 hypothetical protein [Burkholderiales bacterium]MDE2503150.1 hypothetical protein [Burkholderiales bacterium]